MKTIMRQRKYITAAALALAVFATLYAATQERTGPPPPDEPLVCEAKDLGVDGTAIGALKVVSGVELTSDNPRFGGISSLDIRAPASSRPTDAGRSPLMATTDQGDQIPLGFVHDAAQRGAGGMCDFADLEPQLQRLDGPDGPLPTDKTKTDSEGLAQLQNGAFVVSFERDHRLIMYGADGAVLGEVRLPDTPYLSGNGGLEALAVVNGRLYAGAENPTMSGAHPVWRIAMTDNLDTPITVPDDQPGEPDFAIATPGLNFGLTGMDATSDGGLVAVFRQYIPIRGVTAVIGYIPPADLEAVYHGATITPIELARLEPDGPIPTDNFEGIAYTQRPEPQIIIVSDDNFRDQQRTLVYRFTWDRSKDDAD